MAAVTPNMNGSSTKLLELAKSNPLGVALAGLLLLAVIIPPRKRKYKPKRKYSKRRKKKNNPGSRKRKTRSGKPIPRSAGRTRSKKPLPRSVGLKKSGRKPAHMVKGSAAAKAYMRKLRTMRKK